MIGGLYSTNNHHLLIVSKPKSLNHQYRHPAFNLEFSSSEFKLLSIFYPILIVSLWDVEYGYIKLSSDHPLDNLSDMSKV